MAKYAALLRGINVGGRAIVPMPALRAALEGLGHSDVKTLLQSGNVVFTGSGTTTSLARSIERAVADATGVTTTAMVLSRADMAKAVERNPFPDAAAQDPSHLLLVFLAGDASAKSVAAIDPKYVQDEELSLLGRVLYVWYRSGIGRSKLTIDVIERALGVKATGRNWNTATKLLALLDDKGR